MEMQELEITIDKTGKVQIAARGIHGEGCIDVTKNMENALGRVEERNYTAEYYEQPETVSAYQQQDNR